ncbi:MAG: DUF2723 domain-containing protein [Anaerolineae bacterium]
MTSRQTSLKLLGLLAALAILLLAYLPTIQTIPNGSENYYMIDVGETQIVLNRWGTLHATGYPLYVMSGSALVSLLCAFGISSATAPAVVSLLWGVLTLVLIYALALRWTRRPLIAAAATVLFGLTRTMWIHNDIAEVYTMTLFFEVLLLALALWQPPVRGRIWWLALVGGIAVAHHRALIMVAPALIYAVWDDLSAYIRQRPIRLLGLLGVGLLGLIPYAYMYLRAQAGGEWVYGDPGTLSGLIDQFMGREATRFIGVPGSLDALVANLNLVNGVILIDVTLPGVLAGVIGLLVGLSRHRRPALALILAGAAAYLFHVFVYTDILSALILMVTLSLAFGWLFLADWVVSMAGSLAPASLHSSPPRNRERSGVERGGQPQAAQGEVRTRPALATVGLLLVAGVFAAYQYGSNAPFIASLTGDTTGLNTISLVQRTPPGSTLMLAWGPRYFAVGFAHDVLGLLPGVQLVDHKADYRALLAQGMLVTPAFTFYNQPISWWEERIGAPVYLRAVAPQLVQIDTEPELEVVSDEATTGVFESGHRIECMHGKITLWVSWHSEETPQRDLSVFVHLLDANSSVIAQDDHSAPVYGWRPLTTWLPEEVVRDVYSLPRLPGAAAVNFGLYEQRADGSFNNVSSYTLPVECN